MLTSFGEEISQTPLQLAALMSAVANGGTLVLSAVSAEPG